MNFRGRREGDQGEAGGGVHRETGCYGKVTAQRGPRLISAGLAEARRGAEQGLAPRALRLGEARAERSVSAPRRLGPDPDLVHAHARVSAVAPRSLRRCAALCRVRGGERMMV